MLGVAMANLSSRDGRRNRYTPARNGMSAWHQLSGLGVREQMAFQIRLTANLRITYRKFPSWYLFAGQAAYFVTCGAELALALCVVLAQNL